MRALRREAPLLLLLLYGGAFVYAAFGRGVPAFDDHPGQLFRLWHALTRSLPSVTWTSDWNPDWWGGYPELQFYPPGFALLGAALRAALLWQPSIETVYRLLCGVVFLAPGVTTYVLLARVVGDRWLALPPAFLALALSADLRGGVEAGLRWGMLTTRLGFAWLPLLALALRPWVEGGRLPRWAPPLAALAVLSHPSTLPSVVALLGLATALSLLARPDRRTAGQAVATSGFAVVLTVFWSLPLVVRRAWVVPLAWGDLSLGLPGDLARRPVLLALGMAALSAWVAVGLRRRGFDALLAALPLVLTGLFVGDVWLFPRGWSTVEPARLLDGVVQASVWAAGLGAGAIVERLVPARADPRGRPLVALVVIALAAILPDRGARPPTLTVWPAADGWPTLEEVTQRHHLDRLWGALRGGTDRVLFLTSSLRLDGDPAWYAPHSHVTSLAPLRAGREIVHGTFTHPSPVAARFYTGQAVPPARLLTLTERLDRHRLLGEPWERLSVPIFDRFARRLRIGTVVVPTGDVARARFLGPEYVPRGEAAGFTLFERRDRPWPRVERITWRRYRVLVSPTGGVWIPSGIPAYPLWQVKSAAGRLETRVDDWGFLEFRVPVDLFEAELVYAEGWLEWSALALFAAGAGGWLVWITRGRRPAAAPRVRRAGRS
ncbi:MAG TPA: hypothetical protein VHF87_21960 [Methylomirabilota bacterium]|jgi:hypothetical protein|nr:hypothetical protein [Methylomirabilota bacterium]